MRGRVYPPLAVRFAERVDKTPGHGPQGDCWLWTGAKTQFGYGQIGRGGGRGQRVDYAHRVSYEIEHGLVLGAARETGVLVLHRCDNPSCVNPTHLFLGSDADNSADKIAKGRNRTGDQAGERNPRSRLTDDTVRAMRLQRGSYSETAEAFGVSVTTAWNVRNRVTWKHI